MNPVEMDWKADQARHYSEQVIGALIEGTNESFVEMSEEDETAAMFALMAAIKAKILTGPNGEDGTATVVGTLAVAILQLARVERGVPRVTPAPRLD